MFRGLIVAIVLLTGAVTSVGVSPAAAQSSDLFVVHDIPLAKRASTAQAARAAALAEGQAQALDVMLKRLTLSRDWIALPQVTPAQVNALVAAIQIDDEKIAAGSYQAKLTVEFEADGIRNLLRRNDIAFSEARYRPVLILPVYASGGLVALGYGDNLLRGIWEKFAAYPGLIPYKVPGYAGTPEVTLAADTALNLNDDAVAHLREETGTVAVVTVRVDVMSAAGDPVRLHLRARDYSEEGGVLDNYLYGEDDEDLQTVVKRAADSVRIRLEDHWKSQTLARFDERNELHVDVPLTTLKAWRDLQTLLNNNILIDHVDILSLASNRAELMIHYLGPVSKLKLSLAQDNLDLQPVETSQKIVGQAGEPSVNDVKSWRLVAGASQD